MMKRIMDDRQFNQEAMVELNRMLDQEFSKPEHERDYQKIDEITQACAVIMGDEGKEQAVINAGIYKLEKVTSSRPIRIKRRLRYLAIAVAAATMLLTANLYTVLAYQQDLLTVIVERTQNSFSVKYPEMEKIELPTTPDDPYGIKTECAKYKLGDVLAPAYLPEGFELRNCEHDVTEGYSTSVWFAFYRDRKEVIKITYNYYEESSVSSAFPCDDFNLTEIEIQGKPAVVSKEDEQCTLAFRVNANLEITVYTNHLDYQESDKVIKSLK